MIAFLVKVSGGFVRLRGGFVMTGRFHVSCDWHGVVLGFGVKRATSDQGEGPEVAALAAPLVEAGAALRGEEDGDTANDAGRQRSISEHCLLGAYRVVTTDSESTQVVQQCDTSAENWDSLQSQPRKRANRFRGVQSEAAYHADKTPRDTRL